MGCPGPRLARGRGFTEVGDHGLDTREKVAVGGLDVGVDGGEEAFVAGGEVGGIGPHPADEIKALAHEIALAAEVDGKPRYALP